MRLFVAVEIDPDTRAQLRPARTAMERVLQEGPAPPRVTWVKDEAAHVTVRFLGSVPERDLPLLQDALSSLVVVPFDVVWTHVGTFGGMRNPRVIWLAPTNGVDRFTGLAERVNACLEPMFGPGERRPFKPHVTLGRVREPGRAADWTRAVAAVRIAPTVTHVDHITLYESRLSPKGPTYTALSTHG